MRPLLAGSIRAAPSSARLHQALSRRSLRPLGRPQAIRPHSTVTALLSVVENGEALAQTSATATSLPWPTIGAAIVGFPLVLWAYKCVMLIVFQRKIIYMGYLPPLARETKVDPAERVLRGIDTTEVEIASDRGITLRGVALRRSEDAADPEICVVYLQGNLGSPVQRLPLFSHLLLSRLSPFLHPSTVLLAIPPRSYYLSTNSPPSQTALLADYRATLTHARAAYPTSKLVLYGHSLGAAGACCLLASIPSPSTSTPRLVDALILENPFPSVPAMIEESLYPSKWLPYHYLTPFVLDRWDALAGLQASTGDRSDARPSELDRTRVLFVSAEGDTLVKPELVRRMAEVARGDLAEREWLSIKDRSHDDAWMAKRDWGDGVRTFLVKAGVLDSGEPVRPRRQT